MPTSVPKIVLWEPIRRLPANFKFRSRGVLNDFGRDNLDSMFGVAFATAAGAKNQNVNNRSFVIMVLLLSHIILFSRQWLCRTLFGADF